MLVYTFHKSSGQIYECGRKSKPDKTTTTVVLYIYIYML